MERCSFFIKDKALFGSYPSPEAVTELEQYGVCYFVDLTYSEERNVIPYETKYNYINFPIRDHKIPSDWPMFASFIVQISQIIKKLDPGELIYIHCKGGHGRSGVVVACILCYLYEIHPDKALEITNTCHAKRKIMREKWRIIGSPQGAKQQEFVRKFFRPIYFLAVSKFAFANSSSFSVTVPNIGTFPTAEAAYQAFKDIDNKEYVQKQLSAGSPEESKILGRSCKLRADWEEVKGNIMFNILNLKFSQHLEPRRIITNVGLRPIIYHSKNDYWGDGLYGTDGKNILGRQIVAIRDQLYLG